MDIISPKADFCAKELFSHETIRKYFISDVTGIPLEQIRSARIGNPYLSQWRRKQKQGIVDVLVELNNTAKVNIELQITFYSYWDRRNLFYLAKMYTDDLRAGEDYSRLKKSITISLLDFNLTDDPKYHSVYQLRDERGNRFTDLFEVHIIELQKTVSGTDPVDDWIRFFNARSEEELDMIHTKNAGLQMAIEELKRMSLSGYMRARYEAHMKEVRDRNAREHYIKTVGVEEGMEKGLKKGREEGQIEGRVEEKEMRIRTMLLNHKTPEEIADFCGYDLQEIRAVQEQLFK